MYPKILVPVDGSETSALGLEEAMRIAKSEGSVLCLFHVVDEFVADYSLGAGAACISLVDTLREGGKRILKDAEALVRERGLGFQSVLVESIGGPVAGFIVEESRRWPADLIVMGTHGRRGLARLAMGSAAEGVVRESEVPVLLVHGARKTAPAAHPTPVSSREVCSAGQFIL